MPDGTTAPLHSTTDARVWAREWCRIAREIEAADDGRKIIDEGWMIGWFANAIEISREAGYKQGQDELRAATGNLPSALVAKALAWFRDDIVLTDEELDQLERATFEATP